MQHKTGKLHDTHVGLHLAMMSLELTHLELSILCDIHCTITDRHFCNSAFLKITFTGHVNVTCYSQYIYLHCNDRQLLDEKFIFLLSLFYSHRQRQQILHSWYWRQPFSVHGTHSRLRHEGVKRRS